MGNKVVIVDAVNHALKEEMVWNDKMVIYANQTLRAAHKAMMNLLKILQNSESISSINDKLSSMESIFELQSMYEIENKEKRGN